MCLSAADMFSLGASHIAHSCNKTGKLYIRKFSLDRPAIYKGPIVSISSVPQRRTNIMMSSNLVEDFLKTAA